MVDILVVDDDLPTRKMLRFILEQQGGHKVTEAATHQEAEVCLQTEAFNLLLLDVVMPGLDGFELCKRVRTTSNVPILIVSAHGDTPARVRGLQLGADDFLPKPFDPSELAARVEALLRRAWRTPRTDPLGRMHVGSLTLDLGEHRVQVREGRGRERMVNLTPTEFKLLLILARAPGQAISREELQAALWGQAAVDPSGSYNTVNAYISELRNRVEADPTQPRHILTVRGVGYKLEP